MSLQIYIINQLEEKIKNLDKNNELHFNCNGKMITFVGDKNEDQTNFESKIIGILNKIGIKFKENNIDTFRKINDEKCPVYYIADKDYLEKIKKDLEN